MSRSGFLVGQEDFVSAVPGIPNGHGDAALTPRGAEA